MTAALVLGSASPRRSALLAELEVAFRIQPVDIDEQAVVVGGDDELAMVERVAVAKFEAFASADGQPATLLTADTLVSATGVVMGKPANDRDVATMLAHMSGQWISISTALCVGAVGHIPAPTSVTTRVKISTLSTVTIERYVFSGAGSGRAGALDLAGEAGPFIEAIDGCWSNVLGLPLCEVAAALDLVPRGVAGRTRCSVALCGAPGRK